MSRLIPTLLNDLEVSLRSYLDAEEARITAERNFLTTVLQATASSGGVESAPTALSQAYLTQSVRAFVTVDEGE